MPDDSQPSSSRREVIMAGLMSTPALFAGGAAMAQNDQVGATSSPHPHEGKNPQKVYPQPPFEQQGKIPWPGLTSEMTPRPDHGEQTYRGSGKLAGRRALITGGDSGIGRAVAIAYAREGADVAINYLPAEQPDADEVSRLIRDAGRKAVLIPGDLRQESFCQQLVEQTVDQLGGLDIIVNNAGRQIAKHSLEEISTEDFDATFKTNVYAPFWITRAALKHLKPGAVIINTSSIQALDPSSYLVDYAQTKACNYNFTKSLTKQLLEKGIRVNGVAPGPYWTPLQPAGGQFPEKLKSFGQESQYKRPGQPAEIAPLFVLLASSESTYVTGEIFASTGGMTPV